MDNIYNGIVIFGGMGAGKDTLAEQFYNLRQNSTIYNIGVLCREMMKVANVNPRWKGLQRYIGQTVADKLREMDTNIMCDYILALIYERGQKIYGWDNSNLEEEDYNKALLKQLAIIRKDELCIIVGGRTLDDLNYWRRKKYLVVGIQISDEVRRNRLALRDGKETARNSSSKHNTEADVPYIVSNLCDEVITNDGSLEDLRNSAESLLSRYEF